MKKLILSIVLLMAVGVCSPTTFGGIAFNDTLTLTTTPNINLSIVTSRNSVNAVALTATVANLPLGKYSMIHFDSTTNTLNVQLVTSNQLVDGQIIVLDCVGFSKSISITVNVSNSAIPTASSGVYLTDTTLDASTANLTIDALGDAIVLQYVKAKGKYMILSNDL